MHVFLKILTSRKNIASCCLVLNVIGGSNISQKWLTAKWGGYLGNVFFNFKEKILDPPLYYFPTPWSAVLSVKCVELTYRNHNICLTYCVSALSPPPPKITWLLYLINPSSFRKPWTCTSRYCKVNWLSASTSYFSLWMRFALFPLI